VNVAYPEAAWRRIDELQRENARLRAVVEAARNHKHIDKWRVVTRAGEIPDLNCEICAALDKLYAEEALER
jgi:hypothetical protein